MSDRRLALLIFFSLLLAYGYVFPHRVDWNQNSRFDLTAAIVEQGTLSIDAYVGNTGDYALIEGHAYTDKAPGLSLAGAPVYALLRSLTRWPGLLPWLEQIGHSPAAASTYHRTASTIPAEEWVFMTDVTLLTLVTVALPAAALGVLLFVWLGWLGYARALRVTVVFIYGLATPVFPYSATLYGHQPAACLLFAALAWLFRFRQRPARRWEASLIGVMLGWAVITEYPAIWIAAVIATYGVYRLRRPDRVVMLIGGGIAPLVVLGVYNATILGTPFATPYQHLANARLSELVNTGLLSAQWPSPEAMWGLTFSPFRGLFFASPILLLALPGLWLLRRSAYRAEWLASLAIIVGFFVLISASAQWWGGWSAGPRYLVPMLSFLVWPLAETLHCEATLRKGWRVGAQLITIGLVVISIVNTWTLSLAGQYYLPDDITNPLIEYAWPKLIAGDVARNWGMVIGLPGAWSLLPLAVMLGAAATVMWRLIRVEDQAEILRRKQRASE